MYLFGYIRHRTISCVALGWPPNYGEQSPTVVPETIVYSFPGQLTLIIWSYTVLSTLPHLEGVSRHHAHSPDIPPVCSERSPPPGPSYRSTGLWKNLPTNMVTTILPFFLFLLKGGGGILRTIFYIFSAWAKKKHNLHMISLKAVPQRWQSCIQHD